MRAVLVSFSVLLALLLSACDPYNPTPVAIVITNAPTATPPPTWTPPPTLTPTPSATPTPDWTPTPTLIPCEEDGGRILDFNDNPSSTANENLRYRVYVPPCYQVHLKRYPTLYLIHGMSYREQQWDELGVDEALDQGIRLGAIAPMLVVMPYMGDLGTRNAFPPDPSYETFILDELMPQIERDFCVWEERDYRAIGGISRGGFWAYSVALRHPDVFGSVGGHSAFFPNDTSAIPPAFNPLEIALNSGFLAEANLRMYLDNGASDSSGPSQQLFSSRLSARGIAHTYVVHPVGEHNNEYWSAHVSEYLTFYSNEWPREVAALPSCLEASP